MTERGLTNHYLACPQNIHHRARLHPDIMPGEGDVILAPDGGVSYICNRLKRTMGGTASFGQLNASAVADSYPELAQAMAQCDGLEVETEAVQRRKLLGTEEIKRNIPICPVVAQVIGELNAGSVATYFEAEAD